VLGTNTLQVTVTASTPPPEEEQDITPPVLVGPGVIIVNATTANGGTPVTFAVRAEDQVDGIATLGEDGTTIVQDDVGGNINIFCDPASGSEFPIGDTTVQCTATDVAGNTGRGSFTVTVNPPPPEPLTAQITSDAIEGDAPLTVEFGATVAGGTEPYTFNWDFGDGSSGSSGDEQTVAHTYNEPGIYTVTLTVIDANGQEVTSNLEITVNEPPPPPATCDGEIATITGTPGDDDLYGTPGRDVIAGLEGWDYIEGRGGDDFICGGADRDVINGGASSDRVFGDEPNVEGGGNDQIDGGTGPDYIEGGAGDDLLNGGLGSSQFRTENDELRGGAGNDRLNGFLGDDILRGDAGNDRLDGDAGDDILRGDAGSDTLRGGADNDMLSGGSDDDILLSGDNGDVSSPAETVMILLMVVPEMIA
jgi:PKD repeat protein